MTRIEKAPSVLARIPAFHLKAASTRSKDQQDLRELWKNKFAIIVDPVRYQFTARIDSGEIQKMPQNIDLALRFLDCGGQRYLAWDIKADFGEVEGFFKIHPDGRLERKKSVPESANKTYSDPINVSFDSFSWGEETKIPASLPTVPKKAPPQRPKNEQRQFVVI
ncbi:MAG: hypothetical protein V4691_03990 [Pseudomonadota bacterium]